MLHPVLLDNPIWNALSTEHAPLALGDKRARRYPPEIGPLSGIPDQSPQSYEALRPLASPGGVLVLFSIDAPKIPAGWTLIRGGQLHQMIRQSSDSPKSAYRPAGLKLRQLIAADAPAMVALAELTEPGPFRLRTMELGTFFGIFHDGQLVAMAGKRMRLPGLVEVSGVCTHPDARARGYARLLMSMVIDEIEAEGKTAFLHVMVSNPAIHVYEGLGFVNSRTFHLAVLKNDA